MFRSIRSLLAVALVAALVAPAGVALCSAAPSHGCGAAEHSCCEYARLAPCDCGGTGQTSNDAEPPQRPQSAASPAAARAIGSHAPAAIVSRTFAPSHLPPPLDVGERLSLLATLLV